MLMIAVRLLLVVLMEVHVFVPIVIVTMGVNRPVAKAKANRADAQDDQHQRHTALEPHRDSSAEIQLECEHRAASNHERQCVTESPESADQ